MRRKLLSDKRTDFSEFAEPNFFKRFAGSLAKKALDDAENEFFEHPSGWVG
jgi:hypothetical protein